jgi:hypothetical protein
VLFSITRDGRLMRRDDPRRGPLQLSDKVQYGVVRRVLAKDESRVIAVIDPQQGRPLVLLDAIHTGHRVSTGIGRCIPLQAQGNIPNEVLLLNEMLVMIYDYFVDVHNLDSGVRLSRFTLDTRSANHVLRWVHGRFFRSLSGNKWFHLALSSPGGRVAMIEQRSAQCVALVNRNDSVSPWALDEDGNLTPWLAQRESPPVKFDLKGQKILKLLAASHDGASIAVECGDGKTYGLQPYSGKVFEVGRQRVPFFVDGRLNQFNGSFRGLRSRIRYVAVSPNGAIVFGNQNLRPHRIRLVEGYNHMQIEQWDGTQLNKAPFTNCTRPPGVRYDLKVARFADGSRIYLDSRGLLHLKSSDPTIPEMSLVLYDHHVTGWSSNGEHCGDDFFLRPGGTKITAGKFCARIMQFTQRLK